MDLFKPVSDERVNSEHHNDSGTPPEISVQRCVAPWHLRKNLRTLPTGIQEFCSLRTGTIVIRLQCLSLAGSNSTLIVFCIHK